MSHPAKALRTYHQYSAGEWQLVEASVIVERAVTLAVNGSPWLTRMCSPEDLEALAVGALYNEGVIRSLEDVRQVQVHPDGEGVNAWLNLDSPLNWQATRKVGEAAGDFCLTPERVCSLIGQLFEAQGVHRQRGVHTSALSDGERLLVVIEEVGRHNTLDKISGRCLLEGVNPRQRILLTTGRINIDMLRKAARLGVQVIISRSSATSLAIEKAQELGLTLIGYAHRDQFSVYSCPERIATSVAYVYAEECPALQ